MTLPPEFSTYSVYFQECFDFLNDYKWIFSTSNTQYLKEDVLEQFPDEWQEYFITVENDELNAFPDGLNDQTLLPKSLQAFQQKLQLLKPRISSPRCTETKLMKGMSPKKSHEIIQLAKLIEEKLKDKVNLLIDFGAGLGYLSEILFRKSSFNILGLECDAERVVLARKRQKEYYPESTSKVVYEEMNIRPDSGEQIEFLSKEHFADTGQQDCGIIGLHACADLSITAINLFFESKTIQGLVIMPCCYHKLELSEESEAGRIFKNFPLSRCLSEIVLKSENSFQILNRPFLRLACQQTVSRWRCMKAESHREHGIDMFLRAAVECLKLDDVIITKRKGKRLLEPNISFDYISSNYLLKSKLTNQSIDWSEDHRSTIEGIFKKYPNGWKLSEALTCLQTAFQGLCENIVLLDRVCFIQERAQQMNLEICIEVKKILDDQLSPRCFAFIAEKRK
ncbi:unnamed protein product [Hermetia illucens]|uniref:Methyltransferase domain-containing protein n=2 Tax=Hermetia illucens TaxID=343691 RepID=A0A7R8U9Y9_HERIL|nr:unnamed protein product [Hermetia illucens]